MQWLAVALVLVGVVDAAVQLGLVGPHFAYTHDETVYLSQFDPHVPDFGWNAWRAWGTPVLMAPVALFSAGLAATRIWATALTSVGLVAAFWPWLKVVRGPAVPLAALLFATNWMAVYFGNDVQPNIYIALGAVAAVGLFLRATYGENADRRVRILIALAFALFLVALVRPSDALLVGAPLGIACLFVPSTRRWVVAIPIALGILLGWLPWIIEAYQDFGGPIKRYHLSQAHDAVGGLHLNLHTATLYLRILDGPFYAGGQYTGPGPYSAILLAVVAVGAACIVVALVTAARAHSLTPVALPCVGALTLSLLYVFLLGYAAVRFLLPIGALLSLPIAVGLVALTRRRRRTTRAVSLTVIIALVGAEVGLQLAMVHGKVAHDHVVRASFEQIGGGLQKAHLQTPCAVIGSIDPAPVAYWAHCLGGAQTLGPFTAAFVRQAKRYRASGMQVAVVTLRDELPPYFDTWTHVAPVPGVRDTAVDVWISPPVGNTG